MKYTEAEVDAVALAIVNAQRERNGLHAFRDLEHCEAECLGGAELVRAGARAALAARDALFEVVGERWEVRIDGEVDHYGSDPDAMHSHARRARSRDWLTDDECKVVHITTKRRKR